MRIRVIIYFLVRLVLFFLVTVPSLIYGVSAWLLVPVAWLIRLSIGRPIFSYTAGIIALKLDTIFVLLVVPTVLSLFIWKPLGVVFFVWMASYLLIRIYSGVHEKERVAIESWKHLDALEKKFERTYVKYNMTVTVVTIFMSLAAPVTGYYFGDEKGLWIGVALSVLIWWLSPFARETIVEKSDKE